jgi:UDP-2,3-diacylglucosamine pyrophosphatase LpxH
MKSISKEVRDAIRKDTKTMAHREIAKKYDVSVGVVSHIRNEGADVEYKRYVVFNDSHVPFEDKRVLRLIFDFIRNQQPDGVVILGDFTDFYQLSRFGKDPERLNFLQDDIDKAFKYLAELRTIVGKGKTIWYVKGNHEDRLERVLRSDAPSLHSLRCMDLRELLKLRELGIELVDKVELGDLTLIHGDLVRKNAGYSAKAHFDKYGTTMMHGHTHRDGKFTRRTMDGNKAVWENYCTCSLYPEYDPHPDWTHGFSVVNLVGRTPLVEEIPILGYKYFYGGKLYR